MSVVRTEGRVLWASLLKLLLTLSSGLFLHRAWYACFMGLLDSVLLFSEMSFDSISCPLILRLSVSNFGRVAYSSLMCSAFPWDSCVCWPSISGLTGVSVYHRYYTRPPPDGNATPGAHEIGCTISWGLLYLFFPLWSTSTNRNPRGAN